MNHIKNAIKVLILEDETETALDIKETLEDFGYEITDTVKSGEQALESVRNNNIKIYGQMDGIETAEQIKKITDIPIIFLTAHAEKELLDRAKKTRPVNYILKPFEEERLRIAIELAISNFHPSQFVHFEKEADIETETVKNIPTPDYSIINDRIFIKSEGRWVRIFIDDILYLKAEGSGCHIIISDNNLISIRSQNLKTFLEKLNHPKIVRTDRSYAVNIDKIVALDGNTLFLERVDAKPNQKPIDIPISDSYRVDILAVLNLK
jgi:two-component system, response regulator PdtaR